MFVRYQCRDARVFRKRPWNRPFQTVALTINMNAAWDLHEMYVIGYARPAICNVSSATLKHI